FDDPEMYQKRIEFSKTKADQVRATGVGKDGNGILCAPCSICKAQFYPMVEEHELGVEVKGLIDLVGKALVWK
ncbi:MAG: (Fe-S)-binding protein, partial [Desulfotomaculales bacterium]